MTQTLTIQLKTKSMSANHPNIPIGEELTVTSSTQPSTIRRVILHGDFPDGRLDATVNGIRGTYSDLTDLLGPYAEIRGSNGRAISP